MPIPRGFFLVLPSSSSPLPCSHRAVRLAYALRERRLVEPDSRALLVSNSMRGQRLDLDHGARGRRARPVGLIEQRGLDEQRVATPDPPIEGAEFVGAEHFHAGNDKTSRFPRNDASSSRASRNVRATNALDAGTLQPFVQPGITVAAAFGSGGPRDVGVRIERRLGAQPEPVKRRERRQRQQDAMPRSRISACPPARHPSSSGFAVTTAPWMLHREAGFGVTHRLGRGGDETSPSRSSADRGARGVRSRRR